MDKVARLPTKPRLRLVEAQPLTDQQKVAVLVKSRPGDLAAAYLKIRADKRALEEQALALGRKLALLETAILQRLEADGQDGYTAHEMVVYRQTLTTARVIDPAALRQFVLADPEDRLDLLELRASKEGTRNFMETHPQVDAKTRHVITPVPPGIAFNDIVKLGVRKK